MIKLVFIVNLVYNLLNLIIVFTMYVNSKNVNKTTVTQALNMSPIPRTQRTYPHPSFVYDNFSGHINLC